MEDMVPSYHENRNEQEIRIRNSAELIPQRLGEPSVPGIFGRGNAVGCITGSS